VTDLELTLVVGGGVLVAALAAWWKLRGKQ
jgi:hypothetical protein